MSNRDDAKGPTLLTHLDSGTKGIALSFGHEGAAPDPDPLAGSGSGPYTTLRWGRVLVDGVGLIADLVLLFQSDSYDNPDSELMPVSNADIDRRWQDILNQHAAAADALGSGLPFLTSDTKGDFQPYRPLFYCRHIGVFCHPLCPHCGATLTLCRDDNLLESAGLPLYGESLHRFLYCAGCCDASDGAGVFYTRSPMANPPENLEDCGQLIEGFSRLLAKTGLEETLPCLDCDQAVKCYGPEGLAVERMAAFQFYPFYMLAQPAPDISAVDFIALLSGADADALSRQTSLQEDLQRWARFSALQPKRYQGSGFLFDENEKRFLEVLYLKLSFLHELYALLIDTSAIPAGSGSMEGLWIRLGDQGARLPWLWNFSLKPMDPLGQAELQESAKSGMIDGMRVRMHRTWFYVLLANPRQTMASIWPAVQELAANGPGSEPMEMSAMGPVFGAENIFWQDKPLVLKPEWEALWKDAIHLGIQLIQPEASPGAAGNDTFEAALTRLKATVREQLFRQASASPQIQPEIDLQANDQRIGEILRTISKEWTESEDAGQTDQQPTESIPEAPDAQAGRPNEDGDYEETVILTPEDLMIQSPAAAGSEAAPEPDLEKTIVSEPPAPHEPSGDMDRTVVLPPIDHALPDEDLAATVAMTQGEEMTPANVLGKTIGIPSTIETSPEEELEKTVMISVPGRDAQPPASTPVAPAPTPSQEAVDEDLDKTVVISGASPQPPETDPRPVPEDRVPQDSGTPDEEELEATVVIQPRKNTNGKV